MSPLVRVRPRRRAEPPNKPSLARRCVGATTSHPTSILRRSPPPVHHILRRPDLAGPCARLSTCGRLHFELVLARRKDSPASSDGVAPHVWQVSRRLD